MATGTVDVGELNISTSSSTIKINNLKSFFEDEEEVRSEDTEIYPGKKIAFVIEPLTEFSPSGFTYIEYRLPGARDWTNLTETDKFISLELLAGEGVDPPRLAGKVEIILGDSSQSFTFGDPLKEEYLQFDDTSRSLAVKPGTVKNIKYGIGGYCTDIAAGLVHVNLTDAGVEDTLEIRFTLFTPTQGSPRYLSDQNTKIMQDESTKDMKISCGEKDNKKIFNVHKIFFCASSPVFRAAMESDMIEGRTNEIYIEELDEKTLQEMINYVYKGDFTGADLNVKMVAWLADKYDIPGMMVQLCHRMKEVEDVGPEIIADLLISAGKHLKNLSSVKLFSAGLHDSNGLKKIAMEKLRKNQELLHDSAFLKKLNQNILIDIIQEFNP